MSTQSEGRGNARAALLRRPKLERRDAEDTAAWEAGGKKIATTAFWVFTAFYIACALVTWVVFLRHPGPRP